MVVKSLSPQKSLSFQAKVILPVIAVLAVLLSFFVWLVNQRLMDQVQEEAKHTLTSAEFIFRNSFDIRSRNLLSRYENFVNEPRFKAVAQLDEPKTMAALLTEFLSEIDTDTQVLMFSSSSDQVVSAQRESQLDFNEFKNRSAVSIAKADTGEPGADTIAVRNVIFNVISVPVSVNDTLAGVLTIGVKVGPGTAQEMKLLTKSEIAFVANETVAVSTVQGSKSAPQFLAIFQQLVAARHPEMSEVVAEDGEHFLGMAGRLGNSASNVGYVLLSSYEKSLRQKELTQRTLTVLSLIGILFSSLVIWMLIRKITRPLRTLRDSAEAVGRGDFSRHVEVQSKDEYGELATAFNQMMENLTASQNEIHRTLQTLKTTQAQLLQTEKLSAIGEFVAGVAHELNNPLTGVIGFSEMLRESGMNERQQKFLTRVIGSAERCHKVVQSLLSFARRLRPERTMVSINELIESAIEIQKQENDAGDIEVRTELSPDLPALLLDPHQIRQVFLNILNNSTQAIESKKQKGIIFISSKMEDEKVRIIFKDNGPGISADNLSRIFNPFFTTKPVGQGTGLGLSLAYGIIREHGGTITAQSEPNEGVTLIIDLPKYSAEQALELDKTEREIPRIPARGKTASRILVIDDEEYILDLVREALQISGHLVDIAATGKTAIQLATNAQYDLIICDWKIPDMNGQSIYERICELRPQTNLRFVFITGDILSQKAEQFLRDEGKICLLKPFSVEQFRTTVQEVLALPT